MTPTDRDGVEILITELLDAHFGTTAHRILTALESAGVRLVPAEPTEHQKSAGFNYRINLNEPVFLGVYRAMLEASPFNGAN